MDSITNDSFGPLVAYLLPGATVLLGLAPYSVTLQKWLAALPPDAPTLGGFLYLTVASLAAGMTISAIRWAIFDNIHAMTGVPAPRLDFSRLEGRVDGLGLLIEIHYRHYLFFANMQVASLIAFCSYQAYNGIRNSNPWLDAGFLVIEVIFFFASRDTLRKYYKRSEQLLSAKPA